MTQAKLKSLFKYDEKTGIFTRLYKVKGCKPNIPVGNLDSKGYLRVNITLDGKAKEYRLHRLAWLYVHGEMPRYIDHDNHNRVDNRISNLLDGSHQDNMKNQSLQRRNKSGTIGVRETKYGFTARITIDGKEKHLGSFKIKQDAIDARKNAEVANNFHQNHGAKQLGL